MKPSLLFILLVLSGSALCHGQSSTPLLTKEERHGKIETASARVEQVFNAMDDGFEQRFYLVKYHDKYVIVDDPLCATDFSIGDKMYFLVMRHDMTETNPDGKKLLHFMVH